MNYSFPSRKNRVSFTLIELLIVIAILAAILFPVFGRARENARRSSCQSNLKQMALSWQMYTQDYDERALPSGLLNTNLTTLGAGQVLWHGFVRYTGAATDRELYAPSKSPMWPYMKNVQFQGCPSSTHADNDTTWGGGYRLRLQRRVRRRLRRLPGGCCSRQPQPVQDD